MGDAVAKARTADRAGADDVDPAVEAEIERRAGAFVDRVMAAGPSPAALRVPLAEIDGLGADELRGTAAVTESVLVHDRRVVSLLASPNGPVSRALAGLRGVVADLDPARLDAGDSTRAAANRFSSRVAAAEERLAESARILDDGRGALRQETAAIAQQERALWLQMKSLRRYARLGQHLDDGLAAGLAAIATSDPSRAHALAADVLYPIRQRRQELLTHLAVASQGYAALRMIEATNTELVRTIDAAISTTTAVVRAAGLAVRRAEEAQRLGQPVTESTFREDMTAALAALSAVNRSRSSALETMEASLRALNDDVEGLTRPEIDSAGR